MQALILAGGEGTRLRPLTSTVPKPVVPLVDRPFIAFMLDWLRTHGVEDIVISCGHMASGVRNVLGDGSALGITLRYVEEPRPLGTGGALKYAEPLLDDRFLMLNGDVLTDLNLTAQMELHERTGVVLMGVSFMAGWRKVVVLLEPVVAVRSGFVRVECTPGCWRAG